MKTSIATVSISGNFHEKLQAIAAAGFDGIEIFEQDFIAHDQDPREVGRMVRDYGLEITLFQPFRDFEGLTGKLREKAFDRAERKFDVMNEMGTDLILFCSSVHPDSLGGINRCAEDFAELGERAAAKNIRVGYEALAWGKHINDHRDAWEVVRRANHPNIGLILDSFHTLSRKIDPDSIRSIPSDKIFFVQLADAPLIDMDLLYWSRHFRNMPGEGDLDVVGFMRAVAATGYNDHISLEIFNDQFRGGSPRAIAVDGQRSLVYLMDQVRRAEPDIQIELPALPDRIDVEGVEFIEFAADPDEARKLGQLLGSLGFSRTGQHVAKEVELWQQGDIHIVVNTEPEGFAHSAWLTHGTSVCDIGLRVEDAAATVERARLLGADTFSQPRGPQELDIPAIRGVGGGVMHFIDEKTRLSQVWDIEFRPLPAPEGGQDAGLTRVDHIAQTMNYEEMLTWMLFYTSLFKLGKTPMVDVVDPAGLVRSQAIESANGAFRLTLNGAESRRTFAGRFIAESFGSSVQHIALATDDIFATAEKLAGNGFEPLSISSNYYADIDSRFDIDPDLMDRLRRNNILYDEDANGAFFQLYSRTYGEGLFFEIIQRTGGYTGYGAANAAHRTAAQQRATHAKEMPRD